MYIFIFLYLTATLMAAFAPPMDMEAMQILPDSSWSATVRNLESNEILYLRVETRDDISGAQAWKSWEIIIHLQPPKRYQHNRSCKPCPSAANFGREFALLTHVTISGDKYLRRLTSICNFYLFNKAVLGTRTLSKLNLALSTPLRPIL